MPPRRVVRGRPTRRNVEEQGIPNTPEVQPQEEVTNVEFWEAIRMLSQVVTNQSVARTWFDHWKKSRDEDVPILSCAVFEEDLLGRFFPRELREAKVREFRTLKQDSLSVHEYRLKFTQLSRYASEMVADMRSRMSLFVAGLSRLSSKEGKATMLISDMDIARLIVYVQQQKQKGPAPSFASTPAPKIKGEYNGQNSQNFRAKPAHSQGKCRDGSTSCFKYGQEGHFMKECPKNRQGNKNHGNRGQSSSVAPPDRAAPREATSGTSRGANRLYAIASCQEQDDSPDVVTE
ncbi:uncharacterized protein LOC125829577 [Solanum verrucosum]|uniref:uncharacterized protein LOC125829577 n=1 Tax=Solanum verrucosum TaxID=315347 RepID=UPI0020D1E928|nr:uncharacterized protein LOC125829577 [Solanum verrucosum]